MKHLFALLFFTVALFALESGDRVPRELQRTLGMEPDKTYIVDFFASWCASCEKELPELGRLHRRLDANVAEIIGVAIDKNSDNADAFAHKVGIAFRTIHDADQRIVRAFDPLGIPTLYIIKNGTVHFVLSGAADDVDRIVEKHLKGLHE